MAPDLSSTHPRVLIVSRRTLRKNKQVDFVGEYHLDLIVKFGAVPIIVPRVSGVDSLLESFEPIHGVLLCEGEDIDPSLYAAAADLTAEAVEEIRRLHASDTAIDREKDSIEMRLAGICLRRGVPFLGICRGSQVLNVAAGGSLYFDVEMELNSASPAAAAVKHIDYLNYDGHRHAVAVVEETPMRQWFGERDILVNSYHHQGVKRLAERFVPMAFAPDGLVEGFYDPEAYEPEEGKFVVGLQFHPERMRRPESDEFDYPGCESAYQEFVKAAIAYQKKVTNRKANWVLRAPKEMDTKIKNYDRSLSTRSALHPIKESQSQHEAENQLLEPNTALSVQQEKRLKQMGATVRNGTYYLQRLKLKEDKERLARNLIGKMSVDQLSDLLSFYHMMGHICSQVLENKINGLAV